MLTTLVRLNEWEQFLNGEIGIKITSNEQQKKLIEVAKLWNTIEDYSYLDTEEHSYKRFPYFYVEVEEDKIILNAYRDIYSYTIPWGLNKPILQFEEIFLD